MYFLENIVKLPLFVLLHVIEFCKEKNRKKKPRVYNIFLFFGQFLQTHWSHSQLRTPGTQVGSA